MVVQDRAIQVPTMQKSGSCQDKIYNVHGIARKYFEVKKLFKGGVVFCVDESCTLSKHSWKSSAILVCEVRGNVVLRHPLFVFFYMPT